MKIDRDKIIKNQDFKNALKIFNSELKTSEDIPLMGVFGFFFSMGVQSVVRILDSEFGKE